MSKFVVLGASGQLGAVLYSYLKSSGYEVYGISRNGPDFFADIRNEANVTSLIKAIDPDYVINSAALVSLKDCQDDNRMAFEINSYPSFYLANLADSMCYRYAFISTDHYYPGENNQLHSELDPITLVNTYAYSKHIGELYTLRNPNTLVIRTNITGFRQNYTLSTPTFIEWLIKSLSSRNNLSLFSDFFTSTLDTRTASRVIIKLLLSSNSGTFNLASSESVSKLQFATTFARLFGVDLDWHSISSVQSLVPQRANALGLDISKILAAFPDLHLPGHEEVAMNLLNWYHEFTPHDP